MELYPDFNVTDTGFDVPEIDMIVNYTEKDNKPDKNDILPEETQVPKRVKSGDLWKMGNHYLFCGDSLKEESFKILLGDKRANLIFTDPPYNMKIDGYVCGSGKTKHEEFAMASGEMTEQEFINFLDSSLVNLAKYSTDGSIHYICMDWRHVFELMSSGNKVYSELKNICVWNKMQGGMGSLYRSQHEMVFVFKNGTAPHVNNVELGRHGRYRTNVWCYKGVSVTNPGSLEDLKLHPTVKPVAMVMDTLLDCSNPNDIVLDCFAGSGTTLLASERTHRRAYCIEYEPKYSDIIISRYEKLFKGKKAELISNYNSKGGKSE